MTRKAAMSTSRQGRVFLISPWYRNQEGLSRRDMASRRQSPGDSIMRKKTKAALLFVIGGLAVMPARIRAQTTAKTPSAESSPPGKPPEAQQTDERPVSWKRFLPNVLEDQKRIWLFPKSLSEGKHWEPAAAFILGTGALVALDPHDAPYFTQTQTFNGFNRIASSRNTAASMAIVPAALYAFGLAHRDDYMLKTAQLAGEAVLDGEVLNVVMRDISRRLSPRDIPPNGDFSDTWFRR